MIIVFSIWDSIIPYKIIKDFGYGIVNFVLLYSIGGYIRKYYDNKKSFIFWGSSYLAFSLVTFICLFIPIIGHQNLGYNFITNIISAICIFNMFNSINFSNVIINKISEKIFTIFILHLNPYLLSIEYRMFKTSLFWNSKYLIIHMIFTVISLFIILYIVSKLTKKIIGVLISKLVNRLYLLEKTIL